MSSRFSRCGGAKLAIICSAILVVTMLDASGVAVNSASASGSRVRLTQVGLDDGASSPDAAAATRAARRSGHRVEDLSQRTETTSFYANPDGTWTSETSPNPYRVKGTKDAWHELDADLVRSEGGFSPAYSTADLTFSSGGTGPFAAITEDGKTISWSWPGELPTPVIDGDTATYRDVVPNGDLVVIANDTGFTHNVVLRAAPKESLVLPVTVATDGAKLAENQQDGTLTLGTRKSGVLLEAAPPTMSGASAADSVGADASNTSSEDGSQDAPVASVPVNTAVNATSATSSTLTLTPDPAFLNDPDTSYPVTIDPTWTTWVGGDTWVENKDQPAGNPVDPALEVGTQDGGTHKRRAFMNFQNSAMNYKHILSATLKVWNSSSGGNCTAGAIGVAQVLADWMPAGMTWANQPPAGAPVSAFYPAYNAACPAPDFSTFDVTGVVQGWAANPASNFGLRLAGGTETSNNTYRRYGSTNAPYNGQDVGVHPLRPQIAITYNTVPDAPLTPTADPEDTYAPPGQHEVDAAV